MKHEKRNVWLIERHYSWFSTTGISQQYKIINPQRLSKCITDLCSHAKSTFQVDNHLGDAIVSLGDNVPPFSLVCREFEDFKSSHPSENV